MSLDRYREHGEQRQTYKYATCAARPGHEGYTKLYSGTQRAPLHPEEQEPRERAVTTPCRWCQETHEVAPEDCARKDRIAQAVAKSQGKVRLVVDYARAWRRKLAAR